MGYVSEGFLRRVEMKIQASKVPANMTDYPVFVSELCLPQGNDEIFDADGSNPALADGGDIRCGEDSAGNTKMPIDLVEFTRDNTPANGTCEIHTKHSSVSSASDTSFWLFWSKAGASQPADSDADGRDNVWDGNYVGVWHLGDGDSTAADFYKDSTSGSHHGTLTDTNGDTASTTGKLGGASDGALDFAGDADEITVPYHADFNFIDENYTVSFWFNPADDATEYIFSRDRLTDGYGVYKLTTFRLTMAEAGQNEVITGNNAFSGGSWQHVYMSSAAAGTVYIFVDNSSEGSSAEDKEIADTSTDLKIGSGDGSFYYDGKLDELRLSDTPRTANWMTAEYNNQSDPATFILDQTPEATAVGNPWYAYAQQ